MSDSKDKSAPKPPEPPEPGTEKRRSGRVGFDERGNSVWEWQLETGVYSRDITTQKLRKLDLNDLSIAETASHKRPDSPGGAAKAQQPTPGGGFNPYDNARAMGNKVRPAPAAAAPPAKKPVDLKKLEEWIQLKKRLQQQKDDD